MSIIGRGMYSVFRLPQPAGDAFRVGLAVLA